MARSAVTVNQASYNASVVVVKDAIDIANDHSIDISNTSCTKLTILIEKSDTKAGTITLKAGDYSSASQGDLVVTGGVVGTVVLNVETARFKDSDGLILIDVVSTAGMAGNIIAIAHN